jgi:hypothetical protein
VQLALRSDSPGADLSAGPSLSARRVNKFLLAGAAVVGAGAIATQPTTQTIPAIQELQARAVQLVANVTASPATVYQDLFTNTFTNLEALGTAYAANPFPVLSAVIANQQGYADKLSTAIQGIPATFQNWYENGSRESAPGKTLLANIQTAIAAGDFGAAYDNFNKVMLFGLQNTILPIVNVLLAIPPQMAQNLADGVAAVSSAGTLVYGAFQSVFAPVSGAAFEASRVNDAISAAVSSGDIEGAFTALVNAPGLVANAFLNGFDYTVGDTQEAWSGLFSPKGTRASGGPLSQFLITIPAKIAAAIANPTAAATTGTGLAGLFASPQLVSKDVATNDVSTKDVAATDIAGTDIVKKSRTAQTFTLSLAPKAPKAPKAAEPTSTEATDATDLSAAADVKTAVAKAKPVKKPRGLTAAADRPDAVQAAVKHVNDALKKAGTGGRHASNKEATAGASDSKSKSDSKPDSKPKHAKHSHSE